MLRRTGMLAAVLIAGGALMLTVLPASAQSGPPKPQEQGQGEQKQEQKGEGDQKAADQAKAEQEAAARAVEEYKQASAALPIAAGAPECVWTGRRIASLLWRDDIETARRYIDLYDRFGCSAKHLKLVFRCVIQQGPIDPKAADRLASRVHSCWMSPEAPTTTSSDATPSSTAKNGTMPN